MTVLSSLRARAAPAAPADSAGEAGRSLTLVGNSLALIAAKLATLGLGFFFWLIAARLFARADVGLAAAVVSAMMLCTQLALLGVGSSVITHFREHESDPQRLVHSALAIVTVTTIAVAAGFLILAAVALSNFGVVVHSLSYSAVFVVAALCGTVGSLLDQTSTALRRGDQALVRGVVFGGTGIAGLALLGMLDAEGSEAVFLPWGLAGIAVCAVGVFQLRRSLPQFRLRPSVERLLIRSLVRVGIPNHILTLAERVPGLTLPIIVTELVSPRANAAWYAAWMMAWAAYIVPIQVGMTAFAEVARDPSSVASILRRGLRTSLLIGSMAAVALIVLADPLLSLLGESYADDAVRPLRILAIGVIPMCFVYAYYATCRGLRVPQRAMVFGWTNVGISLTAAAIAGSAAGLPAIAASWLGVQTVFGVWAAWRLRAFERLPAGSLPHSFRRDLVPPEAP